MLKESHRHGKAKICNQNARLLSIRGSYGRGLKIDNLPGIGLPDIGGMVEREV